jgi:hypothetical protein
MHVVSAVVRTLDLTGSNLYLLLPQIAQVALLVLALAITFLRCFVRLKIEARALTSSDYLVWGGWFFTLAWVACQCHALYIEIDHPITYDYYSDSVGYLKVYLIRLLRSIVEKRLTESPPHRPYMHHASSLTSGCTFQRLL